MELEGDDLSEVRRKNLDLLMSAFDQQQEIAWILSIQPSYVSRMKSGHVAFSRGKAAELESAFGLPFRWMERENLTLPPLKIPKRDGSSSVMEPEGSYEEQVLLSQYRSLTDEAKKAIRLIVGTMSSKKL